VGRIRRLAVPYIPPEDRVRFDRALEPLLSLLKFATPGELNYLISRIVWYKWEQERRYATANNLVGMLECVKVEFLRRHLGPYEDGAMLKNGDLPPTPPGDLV